MKKNWLIDHCAICGDPFPLTAPLYANMSGTIHQSQLPCPCETRKPLAPSAPQLSLSEMNPEEAKRIVWEFLACRPAVGAKIDLDP